MASARATRDYTSEQIKPLLLKNPEHETNFLPQTVPAFSAITIFNSIRKNYPNYAYREATLNPDKSGGPRRRLGDRHHPLFRRPS